MSSYAKAIQASNGGDYNRAWVLTKLTAFELGPKCWAKLPDPKGGGIRAGTSATGHIVSLAKKWTNEDWDAIEEKNARDRETNKKLIEPMMDAFKQRLFITVRVEGDDCDAKWNSLWLRYWQEVTESLANNPPPAGKAFVTIDVSSKTREVTVDVSQDGTTFTIRAPKDLETKRWDEKIERPLRQLASGFSDDLAFRVFESSGHKYHLAWALTKLHTRKVGKKCSPKLADIDDAVYVAGRAARDIAEWAKTAGAGDWEAIEGQRGNDPATNRGIVEQEMDEFKKRFSFTVAVDGDDCDATKDSMLLKAWARVAAALKAHPPKAKKVAITLTLSAKAKDVTIKTAKDGATFAITVPRDKEPTGWSDKIEKAFEKVSAKK